MRDIKTQVAKLGYADEKAERIYYVHVKPLEDALAKAEANVAALVEALEGMCRLYDSDAGTRSVTGYQQARAALARVKGVV